MLTITVKCDNASSGYPCAGFGIFLNKYAAFAAGWQIEISNPKTIKGAEFLYTSICPDCYRNKRYGSLEPSAQRQPESKPPIAKMLDQKKPDPCTCPTLELVNVGCRCGAMRREKATPPPV